ncbi:hypothetical protein [Colwellia sp. MEBiC06753]
MKNLLLLISASQKLLILLTVVIIALIPSSFEFSIKQSLIVVPMLYLVMTIFAVYFDQRLLKWQATLLDHKPEQKSTCKYKFCQFHQVQ